MLILPDFRAFLNPQIAGISVYNLVVFPDQVRCFCDVMLICRSNSNRMNKPATCIHADVAFHPEFPLIVLFRLVHFRVACFVCVLGGAGGIDNGSIHNRAALHHVPRCHHNPVDCIKKQLIQAICLQQMTEFAQGRFIWNGFCHKLNARKFPHGIAVIDCILSRRIRQVKPNLKQIHPQHFLDSHGRTATLPLGVVWFDYTNPFFPGDNLIHDFQKFFPLGFLLAVAVLDVCKCFLLHCPAPPLF